MSFQFKIQLKNVSKPTVWRKVTVPEEYTFEQFHEVIQVAFGWDMYHLFQFNPVGRGRTELVIGMVDEDFDDFGEEKLDASETVLSDVFEDEGQKYLYLYDFGDDWEHQITLEAIIDDGAETPTLLDGQGACPPEDCGGAPGYAHLKEVLADPQHPEHASMKEWLGMPLDFVFDPKEIELDDLKVMVSEVE
ncbi:pRiA4b ORF-3-like protein [Dyadobacter jejuensis]|uniref:PRiA4b ORF-3-like protein n=1 Tax=Dyadobacter jejuensis TaxID=1082580 RepID=A0A316BDU4_9BACT|nr:plasmid pRiA4b ORF-3 family protein [Dyadobacter jejuensis]PWJ60677.1 pRiA4b ORF-3-like protein [Dyadobacter jejuensis]